MQVLALIEGTDHPCYRYRLEAFAWSMAQQGLYLEALPLRRGLLPRIAQLFSVRRADVVILQRKLLPLWQLALLRGAAKRLIYDVDDALFQRDSYHARGPMSRMRHGRFAATVRVADLVIAGNEYLREQVVAHAEPGRVRVVPTCIQPAWYAAAAHERIGPAARLVWIGQRSTLSSLQCAEQHLAAAAECLPGLQLRVISDSASALSGVRVVPGPGRRPPRRRNSPRGISASVGCPTTPGAAASAACACCNTWPPVCPWSPIPSA